MNAIVTLPETVSAPGLNGDDHYEIVNGERVELPPMGAYQSTLASLLDQMLGWYVRDIKLGRVAAETLFQLQAGGKLQRKPDVAFVSYARWPKNRQVPDTNAWDVVPNLAIEVNSRTNTVDELLVKIEDYFAAGVERVWVIVPKVKKIYVYRSPTGAAILKMDDVLEGDPLLPGFRLPLADLFDDGSSDLPTSNGTATPS